MNIRLPLPWFVLAVPFSAFTLQLAADENFEKLRETAEKGSTQAEYDLTLAYREGRGTPVSAEKSLHWCKLAAEHGIAAAQYDLGAIFANGAGVPEDFVAAFKWYGKAAEQNHAQAQLWMGVECLQGGENHRDFAKAMEWFQKAAKQGLTEAKFFIGMIHMAGAGVPKSTDEAVKWLTEAAEQGDVRSQCRLGIMYAGGEEAKKNMPLGGLYLNLAAMNSDRSPEGEEAMEFLGELEEQMKKEDVEKYRKEAGVWAEKAAEKGMPEALYTLSNMYARGRCRPKDAVCAYAFALLAQKSGKIPEAAYSCKELEKSMTAAQLAEARRTAKEWKPIPPAK